MPRSSSFDSDDDLAAAEPAPDPTVERRRRFARTRVRALVAGMLVLIALVWLRELLGVPAPVVGLVAAVVLAAMASVCVAASESWYRGRMDELRRSSRQRRREKRLRVAAAVAESQRVAAWKARQNRCPECDGEMAWIKLVDARGGALCYADVEARARPISGEYPIAGEVYGEICVKCTRIVLRGAPL